MMSNSRDAVPVNSLRGMPVLSLATGNKLGIVDQVFIDPAGGGVSGLSLEAGNGDRFFAPCSVIHSFGRDAVMARDEGSVVPVEAFDNSGVETNRILEAKVITESGKVLGQISDIYLAPGSPPAAIFQVRKSLLDKLLGRELYIPANSGHTLSDDAQRLVVPDSAAETISHSVNELAGRAITVRSYPIERPPVPGDDEDVTVVRVPDEDETVVRSRDEDETVVRLREDDDTVVRMPRKAS